MLIAVAGLAGAGKTTATRFLERAGLGQRYYAGEVLHEEVRRRRLELTPANERAVREEMRSTEGGDVFARRALPRLATMLSHGCVFLDAIYCLDEFRCYENLPSAIMVLGIETHCALRAERLVQREERSMTPEELEKRDRFELAHLGLRDVLGQASYTLSNDGNLPDFEKILRDIVGKARIRGSC